MRKWTLFYTISPLKVSSTEDCNSALTEYKMKHDVAMYQQINNKQQPRIEHLNDKQ